jgi:epoxyqueuosine reductase
MILVLVVAKRNIRSAVEPSTLPFDGTELSLAGLNLQAVINIKDCPSNIRQQLSAVTSNLSHYNQLILIGHAGQSLWDKVKASNFVSIDPIDVYSKHHTTEFFRQYFSEQDYEIVFPTKNQTSIGLQALGKIVGWHNESPFRVGINQKWGSWFAYRAVVLIKANYLTSAPMSDESPCNNCVEKPCIAACPANALVENSLDIVLCTGYRMQSDSQCKDRCIARMTCPIAKEHQYKLEQIGYHYSLSMKMIESYQADVSE